MDPFSAFRGIDIPDALLRGAVWPLLVFVAGVAIFAVLRGGRR